MVFTMIGKKQTIATIVTFERSPKPSHNTIGGAMATFGIACDDIRSGSTVRENAGHMKMPRASGTPMTSRPTMASTMIAGW